MKIQNFIITLILITIGATAFAQKPTQAPKAQNSSVDFSRPENIVLYVVLPIIFILLYFVWRRTKRRDKTE